VFLVVRHRFSLDESAKLIALVCNLQRADIVVPSSDFGGTRMENGRLARSNGVELAWQRLAGRSPTAVFLPGSRSDMSGEKAAALASFCEPRGQALLLFDYSGHGLSSGQFEDGTVGLWTADALAAIDQLTEGPLVLVGSSMGGWIALLCAVARRSRIAALVGIAAAPDFTEALLWQALSFEQRATMMTHGVIHLPSRYGEPTPVTSALIEDGREHLVLDAPIELACPVRLLQGQQDPAVPWELALRLAAQIAGPDVQLTLVKDGDHRLSRPQDLALLRRTLIPLLGQDGA
jgi:pimeloyl-ACP methyl ester carboxylesterase